jgi:hypothetical protein
MWAWYYVEVNKLTSDEITNRLIDARNLRRLYDGAQQRIIILEMENKQLKIRIKQLEGIESEGDFN